MAQLEGKTALITGGARGQGRAHAVRLAQDGADVVAVDIAEQIDSVHYAMSTESDLDETRRAVEAVGGRCRTIKADVRRPQEVDEAVAAALESFGRLDIVVSNHGVGVSGGYPTAWELTKAAWDDQIDVNLTGHFNVARAVSPVLIEQGDGGAIVFTSSAAGMRAFPHMAGYATAKHALVGLMRTLAAELAPHHVRVNSVHPTAVASPMFMNEETLGLFAGGKEGTTPEQARSAAQAINLLPVPWLEPEEIAKAVAWLVSEDARYVTGVQLPVDAGCNAQPPGIPPIARDDFDFARSFARTS